MYSYEEQCIMDLADNYTLLYSFLGRSLIDAFGVAGEKALREGTRRYGRDRGYSRRDGIPHSRCARCMLRSM